MFARLEKFKKFVNIRAILAAVLIFGAIALFFIFRPTTPVADAPTDSHRSVQLASIGDLTRGESSFSVIGTVASQKEVTIHAESGGNVTYIGYEQGDSVAAGSILAELENSAQRAAVMQATGGRDAAAAALAKVQKGARQEQLDTLQSAADTAKSGVSTALLSAYAAMEDVVHHSADPMFSNPNSNSPTLLLTVSDSQLSINAETQRQALTANLARDAAVQGSLSSIAISQEVKTTEAELLETRTFIDTLIAALDKTVPSSSVSSTQITTYKATMSAARSSVTGSLSALTGAFGGYTAAKLALEQGVSGAQQEDIDAAQASLTSAEGGLAAARAALEKTRVRSPISGTLNSFSLSVGDFVSAYTPVATVANNHALEITTYVNEADVTHIATGESVQINTGTTGTITRIAPALNADTKKIEVKIGVPASTDLVNGASVTISFGEKKSDSTKPLTQFIVPLTAVKLGSDIASVFTVSGDNKTVAHAVSLGTLLGDRVAITGDITESDLIITDARGLHEGQEVVVE